MKQLYVMQSKCIIHYPLKINFKCVLLTFSEIRFFSRKDTKVVQDLS